MARGEEPNARPSALGIAIGCAFLTLCVCALSGLLLQVRSCSDLARLVAAPPAPPAPSVGAQAAVDALPRRDTTRRGEPSTAHSTELAPRTALRVVLVAERERPEPIPRSPAP